jgi:hypothetical protein
MMVHRRTGNRTYVVAGSVPVRPAAALRALSLSLSLSLSRSLSLSLSLSLVVVVRVYCCCLPSGMQLPLARTSRYSTYVRILLVQPACHCRCCVVRDMSTRYVYTYYPCTCMVHAGPVRAVRVHGTTRRDHRACTRPFIGMHGRRI